MINENYFKPERPELPSVDYKVKICVAPNSQPFSYRPRRLSQYEKSECNKIINELLAEKIIQKSNSEFSSPFVLVKKKNKNELRLCVDYRSLNKITIKDNFPLPLIEDQLDQLRDKKFFSFIDLRNAFHHISVDPDSVKYTSFVCPFGQYEYVKLPLVLF